MASLFRTLGIVALGFLVADCTSLQPAMGVSPQVGTKVAFDVTDAGRVALGGTMGPEIAQVEGQLVEKDSAGYLLSVSSVRLLRGGEQVWSGERIQLKLEYLSSAYVRKFSLGRSIALGVVGVGGFATFMATRSLLGLGPGNTDSMPTDTIISRLGRP